MTQKLFTLLSTILGIPSESITAETSPENTPSWDSFNGIMIAAELEKSSGIKFTIDDVLSVKNVGDIKRILEKYQVPYEC